MDSTLRKAINEKRLLEIMYNGSLRVVEPHCYGVTAKGNLAFMAFDTNSWKVFELSKVTTFKLLTEKFSARGDYSKDDKGMSHIHCEI